MFHVTHLMLFLQARLTEDVYLKKLFDNADQDKTGYLKFTEFLSVYKLIQIDGHNRSHHLGEEGGHGHSPHHHRYAF